MQHIDLLINLIVVEIAVCAEASHGNERERGCCHRGREVTAAGRRSSRVKPKYWHYAPQQLSLTTARAYVGV